jgi:hypothetical protein
MSTKQGPPLARGAKSRCDHDEAVPAMDLITGRTFLCLWNGRPFTRCVLRTVAEPLRGPVCSASCCS